MATVALGMVGALLAVSPAGATERFGKWAPAVRAYAYVNDDGRAGTLDPNDVGDVSVSYDRWGSASSDDPSAPGMDASRVDGDVARCAARNLDAQTMRVTMQNAYPGYTCSFVMVTINKMGVKLVIDNIEINVDPALQLTEIDTPQIGDVLKQRRRLYGTYAVTVLQEAMQGATLEFDIRISLAHPQRRRHALRCCNG